MISRRCWPPSVTLRRVDYADAFAVERRRETPDDPMSWGQAIFNDVPLWVATLMRVRETLVGLVGIDRSTPDAFAVVAQDDDEVLFGSDARHLDFRASVRREPGRTVLTTVVQLHNWRGQAYFALIRPAHPFAVRAVLNRAAFRLARSVEVRPPRPRRQPTPHSDTAMHHYGSHLIY